MIAAALVLAVVAGAAPAAAVPLSATVASVPAASPMSATIASSATPAPPASATVASVAIPAAPVSATVAAAPGWSASDLERLRCLHARHVRDRDEGWTFSNWLDPMKCPDQALSAEAKAAWERYEKRARRYDECMVARRTRGPRTFLTGFAAGGIIVGGALGIARRDGSVVLTAAVSTGVVAGVAYWFLDRRRPDPPCGAEPAVEWPR